LQWWKWLKISFCEIFGVVQFSTFATLSGAKQTFRRSAATSVFDRSGHRRQIKSNGLSEAGSIEKNERRLRSA